MVLPFSRIPACRCEFIIRYMLTYPQGNYWAVIPFPSRSLVMDIASWHTSHYRRGSRCLIMRSDGLLRVRHVSLLDEML